MGIFARSMDEKWNIFVLDDILFCARSWTNFCVYKVFIEKTEKAVLLKTFHVNRDINQYRSAGIEADIILLKKLLQRYLNREDFYKDPKLEMELIKQTIEESGLGNDFKKSIGTNTVGITKQTYSILSKPPNDAFFEIRGWADLEKKLLNKPDDENLSSLYIEDNQNSTTKTFYFDKELTELLGEITIIRNGIDFNQLLK